VRLKVDVEREIRRNNNRVPIWYEGAVVCTRRRVGSYRAGFGSESGAYQWTDG